MQYRPLLSCGGAAVCDSATPVVVGIVRWLLHCLSRPITPALFPLWLLTLTCWLYANLQSRSIQNIVAISPHIMSKTFVVKCESLLWLLKCELVEIPAKFCVSLDSFRLLTVHFVALKMFKMNMMQVLQIQHWSAVVVFNILLLLLGFHQLWELKYCMTNIYLLSGSVPPPPSESLE